jgi:hypothetical protein
MFHPAALRRLKRLIDRLLNVAGSRIIAATQGRSHAIVADVGQQLRLLLTRADERGGSGADCASPFLTERGRRLLRAS